MVHGGGAAASHGVLQHGEQDLSIHGGQAPVLLRLWPLLHHVSVLKSECESIVVGREGGGDRCFMLAFILGVVGLEQIPTTTINPCNQVILQVTVANTGKVAGDEVVQVYMTFKVSRCA